MIYIVVNIVKLKKIVLVFKFCYDIYNFLSHSVCNSEHLIGFLRGVHFRWKEYLYFRVITSTIYRCYNENTLFYYLHCCFYPRIVESRTERTSKFSWNQNKTDIQFDILVIYPVQFVLLSSSTNWFKQALHQALWLIII